MAYRNPYFSLLLVVISCCGLIMAAQAAEKPTKAQVRELYRIFNASDLAGMKGLLEQGLDVNADMGGGVTLLLKAANIGPAEMVKLLLDKGADVHRCQSNGDNALMQALSNSRHFAEIVPLLLEAGVDVKVTNSRNGYNPVWKALQRVKQGLPGEPGVTVLRQILEKGADPNAPFMTTNQKLSGLTPLMQTAGKGQAEVVKLLLAYGADSKAITQQGNSAADFAREKGHEAIVAILADWRPDQAGAVKAQAAAGQADRKKSAQEMRASCRGDPREPWCYQEQVEKLGDPALCEPILEYWPNALGVHGWCYYRLAIMMQDCRLCDKIKKEDIHRTCRLDACR